MKKNLTKLFALLMVAIMLLGLTAWHRCHRQIYLHCLLFGRYELHRTVK